MTATRHFLLAAGGTGGHMLPAYALAGELIARGHRVALVSDDRGLKIPGAPAEMETHVLPAGRVSGGPVGWLKAALAIRKGRRMAIDLIDEFDPAVVADQRDAVSARNQLAREGVGGQHMSSRPAGGEKEVARRCHVPALISCSSFGSSTPVPHRGFGGSATRANPCRSTKR